MEEDLICNYCSNKVITIGGSAPCHIFCPKCGYHRDCTDL